MTHIHTHTHNPASELIGEFYQDLMTPKPVPVSAQLATLYVYEHGSRHLVGIILNCSQLRRLLNNIPSGQDGRDGHEFINLNKQLIKVGLDISHGGDKTGRRFWAEPEKAMHGAFCTVSNESRTKCVVRSKPFP